MHTTLREFIRRQITLLFEEISNDDVINDTEEMIEDDEEEIEEFSSVGGAGAIGQFGWAVPLGGKSNAKAVEKKNKKSRK